MLEIVWMFVVHIETRIPRSKLLLIRKGSEVSSAVIWMTAHAQWRMRGIEDFGDNPYSFLNHQPPSVTA